MKGTFIMPRSAAGRALSCLNSVLGGARLNMVPSAWAWRTFESQSRDVYNSLGIDFAVDVGANTGQWFRWLRLSAPTAVIHSYECDDRALVQLHAVRKELNDKNWSIFEVALSDSIGAANFNRWSVDSGQSSLLDIDPEGPHFETVSDSPIESTTVITDRLDARYEAAAVASRCALLKIDVQGTELAVLRGAGELLRSFSAVEIELSLVNFYRNSDLIEDALRYLRDYNFHPLSIQTPRWGGANGSVAGALDADLILVRGDLIGK